MSCEVVGIYKKGSSVKATIKFNVLISSFSDIFITLIDGNGNILAKYSKNAHSGYDSSSVKVSTINSKWLEVYIDTSVTATAVADAIYNMDLDYRITNSNYSSGVEVKILEAPVMKFVS